MFVGKCYHTYLLDLFGNMTIAPRTRSPGAEASELASAASAAKRTVGYTCDPREIVAEIMAGAKGSDSMPMKLYKFGAKDRRSAVVTVITADDVEAVCSRRSTVGYGKDYDSSPEGLLKGVFALTARTLQERQIKIQQRIMSSIARNEHTKLVQIYNLLGAHLDWIEDAGTQIKSTEQLRESQSFRDAWYDILKSAQMLKAVNLEKYIDVAFPEIVSLSANDLTPTVSVPYAYPQRP